VQHALKILIMLAILENTQLVNHTAVRTDADRALVHVTPICLFECETISFSEMDPADNGDQNPSSGKETRQKPPAIPVMCFSFLVLVALSENPLFYF
jgi:hypothetical protein